MRKIGNIYQGGGLKKVGNIHDKNFGVQQKQDNFVQIQQAQQQREAEARQANSWRGLAANTVKGLFPAAQQVSQQIVNHPLDSLASAGSGVYKGAIKPFVDIQKYTNPAMFIPGARGNIDRLNQMLDYKPKNDTSQAIKSGFEFSGATVPYTVAGEAIGGIKALQNTPRLAKYLGYTVPGQIMSDKKITDVKGRGQQLALDSLLFGLTGGLKTPKIKENIPSNKIVSDEEIASALRSGQIADRVNKPKSVLQIKDAKTGKVEYKTIRPEDQQTFMKLVDNPQDGNIAGKEIDGKIYHLTAKGEAGMNEKGAKFMGEAKLSDVPHPLQEGGITAEPNTQNIEQQIIEKLGLAKSKLGERAKMISEERSRRVGAISGIGEQMGGEAGIYKKLGALKGEMPKPAFEPIRGEFKQTDIDVVANKIEANPILTPFEKLTSQQALLKIFNGEMPSRGEIEKLGETFSKDFIDAVLEKRSTMQKLFEGGADALNVPRSLMASMDLSAPLRQGIFLIPKHPILAMKSFGKMFKYAFSEGSYQKALQEIQARPSYLRMKENKLALTDMTKGFGGREERFMSNLAEKIPGIGKMVRGSDRAYTGFLNNLRADVYDNLEQSLGKEYGTDIARFVNSASGRGELPKLLRNSAELLNGALFSPRLMMSRINMLSPRYYMSLAKPVRMEALKSLFSFGGALATVLSMAKLGGAEVGSDPRSADFGKIKVGNTRYDIAGGFQQYAVLASRLATGEYISSTTGKQATLGQDPFTPTGPELVMRFLQSKESPVVGYALSAWSKKDQMGQPFNKAAGLIDRVIPMMAQDISDLVGEYGSDSWPMAIPGTFGVGLQTYTDQIPVMETTPGGKPTVKWNPYPSIGEKAVNAITGTELSQIPQDQWSGLQEERNTETQRNIQYKAAKQRVLDTGKPETIGDTYIWLQNGVIKTKKLGDNSRTPLKERLLRQQLQERAKKAQPFYQP